MTDQRFCVECGKELSPGDRFCPSCGATIRENEYWGDVPEGCVVATASVEDRSGTLKNVAVMTLIWAGVALFIGICTLACLGMIDQITDNAIEELKNTGAYEGYASMWDYLVANGYDESSFKDLISLVLIAVGGMFCLSGIFAGISGFLDIKKTHYTVSMVFLVFSIIFSGFGLLCLIVGIVVAVYLSKCKCEFTS